MTEFLEQDDDSKLMSSSIYLAAFLRNSMVAEDAEGCRSGITHRTYSLWNIFNKIQRLN